jgi:hypothetical protein
MQPASLQVASFEVSVESHRTSFEKISNDKKIATAIKSTGVGTD